MDLIKQWAGDFKKSVTRKKNSNINLIYARETDSVSGDIQNFCEHNRNSYYFDFAGVDAQIAPSIFSSSVFATDGITTWQAFFELFSSRMNAGWNHIFFDHYLLKNDKEEFFDALERFHRQKPLIFIALITDDMNNAPENVVKHEYSRLRWSSYLKENMDRKNAGRLFAVTGGNTYFYNLCDFEKTFEENLINLLHDDTFMNSSERMISRFFRTPESYNMLMYAMALGNERLSEIAAFAGFQNNKCDKYLKMLIEKNFVVRNRYRKPGRTIYTAADPYMTFWYKCIYPNRSVIARYGVTDELITDMTDYIDTVLVPNSFRDECFRYLKGSAKIDVLKYENDPSIVKGYDFDYVLPRESESPILIKIWDASDARCDKKEFNKLVRAADKLPLNYYNEYYLFLNGRFTDYCWKEHSRYPYFKLIQPEWL